jgi:hypothetical protein
MIRFFYKDKKKTERQNRIRQQGERSGAQKFKTFFFVNEGNIRIFMRSFSAGQDREAGKEGGKRIVSITNKH